MTGMANGAPPAPAGAMFASSSAPPQPAVPSASSEPVFQPSPEQQQLLMQARAHAASLALQSAQRRDLAAHAGISGAGASAVATSKLQQRAAVAAQALGSERKVSAKEIQALLEKNEAALRMWNALHRQQPPVHQQVDHKEWLKKCYLYRQQIGARLEVLASLADRQIAHEDANGSGKKTLLSTPTSAAKLGGSGNLAAVKKSPASSNTAPVAAGLMPVPNAFAAAPSVYRAGLTTDTTSFQPQPFGSYGSTGSAVGTVSLSSGMAGISDASNLSRTGASALSTAVPANSAVMSASMSTTQSSAFAPTAFNPTAATAQPYMNQAQNFMMNPATMAMNAMAGAPNGTGMMNPQQFMMMQMQMPMGMNMAAAGMYGQSNMYANVNYSMMGGGTNPLPMDPFNASLSGFGQPTMGFPSGQSSMNGPGVAFGMSGSSMQTAQMMNQMGGGYPPMMANNFQYGSSNVAGMAPTTQGMSSQQLPQQQQRAQMYQSDSSANSGLYQPPQQTQQQLQQQPQQPPQQVPEDLSGAALLSDAALFDDDDMGANLFEGFSDDAFLPLQ